MTKDRRVYHRIQEIVSQIPPGTVATYGQIASIEGNSTPRMVGYALATLDEDSHVPWHRVINAQGGISPRGSGPGSSIQRERLEEEGVIFIENRVDFDRFGWAGPEPPWLEANSAYPAPRPRNR